MMEKTHEFNVTMTCGGCSRAVERVLSRMEGISKIDISLEKQLVTVTGSAEEKAVFEAIKKTGKPVTTRTK